jgi:hypothetical protein
MSCTSRRASHGMTAIGTSSNHGLPHLATLSFDFAAGFANLFSCCYLARMKFSTRHFGCFGPLESLR